MVSIQSGQALDGLVHVLFQFHGQGDQIVPGDHGEQFNRIDRGDSSMIRILRTDYHLAGQDQTQFGFLGQQFWCYLRMADTDSDLIRRAPFLQGSQNILTSFGFIQYLEPF